MTAHKDVFADMKNEDRRFGERGGKEIAAKNSIKRHKHPVSFKNYRPDDLRKMSDDYKLEDESLDNLEDA